MIILHQLLQLGGARPIQAVQLQRAAVGVVVAMLGAGKLFAPLHERQTLAGQVNTRRHAVLGDQVVPVDLRIARIIRPPRLLGLTVAGITG